MKLDAQQLPRPMAPLPRVRLSQASAPTTKLAIPVQEVGARAPVAAQYRPVAGGTGSVAAGADVVWSMLESLRETTFRGQRFERGLRLEAQGLRGAQQPGGHRGAGLNEGLAAPASFRGAMGAPEAQRDATTAHPLYGRYLEQWLAAGPDLQQGKMLLQLFQERLRDLKQTVRGLR